MRQAWLLCTLAAIAVQPSRVRGQFGGSDFTPPAPKCPLFTCPAGEKPVGRPQTEVVTYGCQDAGMNILSMADLDPNDPYGALNKKRGSSALNKCCVERDICKQTCGMSAKECHDSFQKCSQKVCKTDQNCKLQAMISDMSNDPFDNIDDLPADYKYDPEETKCRGYNKAQAEVCRCVPEAELDSANEEKLKLFYGKYNPEKLDASGEIKDASEVWNKWKGKLPSMFSALATKYKDKVVQVREKPKPRPRAPSPQASPSPSEPESEGQAEEDAEETDEFQQRLKELTTKKDQAKQDEDFDLAAEVKSEIEDLTAKEVKRLKAEKVSAVEREDYAAAKSIKRKIAKLEEL